MKVGDIFIVNRRGQNRDFMISLCNLLFLRGRARLENAFAGFMIWTLSSGRLCMLILTNIFLFCFGK